MDNLIAAGKARPFIIVMDNGGGNVFGGAVRGAAPKGAGAGEKGRAEGRAAEDSTFRLRKILTEELIPFIDANYRTLPTSRTEAMAGLSMGGMQTRQITLANLDKFSHIGMFSGGSIAPDDPELADPGLQAEGEGGVCQLRRQGDRRRRAKANQEALEKMGIRTVYYESPDTAHEWQSWRRSLYLVRAAAVP